MIKNIIVLFGIAAIAACGSGSTASNDGGGGGGTTDATAPTVSVTKYDAGANTALSSTAPGDRLSGTVADSAFTATFSEAMDRATVVTDNIELACNGIAEVIGDPASSDDTVWTVTPLAALTGYSQCTLTFGSGLKDASGDAMAAAAFVFNTQCSTDDLFQLDTLGFTDDSDTEGNCWAYYSGFGSNRPTYFTVADSAMRYASGDTDCTIAGHNIFKTFSATSFTATIEILSPNSNGSNNTCNIELFYTDGDTDRRVNMSYAGIDCNLVVHGTLEASGQCAVEPSDSNPLFMQLIVENGAVSAKYGYGSIENVTSALTSGTSISLPDSYRVGINCRSQPSNGFSMDIGAFTIDATAAGPGMQY